MEDRDLIMPVYNHTLLNGEESLILAGLLERYKNYDKLDILIEMIIDPADFFNRTKKKS